MFWFLYNVLFVIGFTLCLPYYLFRMARRGGYRRGFLQRIGIWEPAHRARIRSRPRFWIHAVSVGEVQVALRVMDEMRARDSATAFLLTTTTSTGYALARTRLNADDELAYFPIDFPPVTRRALDAFRPLGILIVETELWPNLIRLANRRGVPVALVNGRLSERSCRRYRWVRSFFRRAIHGVGLICAQTEEDARRFKELGADPLRLRVTGSVKYDVAEPDSRPGAAARGVLDAMGVAPTDLLWVAGSTWPGEETAVLKAFAGLRRDFPSLKLVLVPRHAERSPDVEAELRRTSFSWIGRRAMAASGIASPRDVLLLDTTGELAGFYACATVVFVGKSLTCHGGQNVIEPAMFGKPVLTGPHTENFAEVVRDLTGIGALQQVSDVHQLEAAIRALLSDVNLRNERGMRAGEFVRSKRGAVVRTVDAVLGAIAVSSATSRNCLFERSKE